MADLQGWGSIYCSMEKNEVWGDRSNIQHSIPVKPDCLLLSDTQEYIERVELAGGTIEAKQCLDDALYGYGFPFKP